jgi:hypothetical protein
MRMFIALLVVVYLVGIGVVLAPTVEAKWNTGSTSQFVTSIATEMPTALAWPATIYRKSTARG